MKKTLLLFCAVVLGGSFAIAQTCERDSSIYLTSTIVSPAPWSADSMFINTKRACPGEPYAQSVTFNVPESATIPGVPIPIMINSIAIATTGAITGLPPGIGYSCDPPNCVFNKLTLGCLLLSGTVGNTVIPGDSTELKITVMINSPQFGFPVPIEFPGQIAPGQKYFIKYNAAGECVSGTLDPSGQIAAIKNVPNPFTDQTYIKVESTVSGKFQFDVFDVLGQRVYSEKINLLAGSNEFTFEAGDLANGTYYYSIGNAAGKATRMMVIAK